MSINPRKFYKVDGILLEGENGENYPRNINQKGTEKNLWKSLEEDKIREKTERKPEECVLSDRQICENIHYFYYDIKSDFLNQFIFEILEDVIMEEENEEAWKT